MIRKFLQIVLITLSTINVSMAIGDPWKIISDAHQAAKNLNSAADCTSISGLAIDGIQDKINQMKQSIQTIENYIDNQ